MKLVAATLLLSTFVLALPATPPEQHRPSQSAMSMTAPIKSEPEFIRGMIPHHQEAVDSAVVIARNSERPELRAFAQKVIAVQTGEIKTLQRWLRAWYPNQAEASRYTPMMRNLPDATPNEADRTFIEDMIMHHEMAVAMAQQFLVGSFTKHPKAEALARDIIKTQTAEVATLQGWLRSWYGVTPG